MFHPYRHPRFAATICKRISAAACIATAVMQLSGCNDEVFVKPLPEMEAVELSPEGGHAEVSTGVAGAWFLSYSSINSMKGSVYLLDERGDRLGIASIGGAPVPGGLEIVTVDPSTTLKIMATPEGSITIDLDHCYTLSGLSITATLEYNYGVVDVPIRIPAIEPFAATSIKYVSEFSTFPDEEIIEGRSITVENNSTDSLPMILEPLAGATAGVIFVPSDNVGSQIPVDNNGNQVELPSIGADGPGLYGFSAPYLPERQIEVPAPGLPSKNVTVMVPPESKRRYTCFVERRLIHARYVVSLGSPSVEKRFESGGNVRVSWPVGYVIGYNDL
ncbi:MAG: hypothetical protein HDR92_08610 [Bacteroides sp.]|nr:hypothetical protein [Bacteroides sp.]